ncbi:prephenate/arogenate dehydrogenase family protein [Sneathiella sp. P13V-1]|uniref:prephenate/arogenate dehydrogenase family protein n=1 Tax=Sneathiella sp. P13V-1 TaxID=2697366 RepID=UPI00187B5F60|nr:prephenate/arogenate dehydrogenase family protein [Sneathiella sp. P13V-1]MBE7635686.1 prephenate/arogenate dehydrogenase family protein [Sneathiella sp. P13V-1]
MSDTAQFKKLALIGIGLIGSSIARGVRQKGLAEEIVCSARTHDTRRVAMELGVVDHAYEHSADAVKGADLVIFCTPVGTYGKIAEEIAPHLEKGALISDVGSVKKTVVDSIEPHIPEGVDFVAAHPVAGTEKSGPAAGFAELFQSRWCILTPSAKSRDEAVEKLSDFWAALGSNVETMDPKHHDLVLAITSHVPHLIAYNIVGTADDLEEVTQSEVIKYSAGGFRDFTRIAASDPTMWRDVFLHNKDAVLEMLGRFTEDLSALQRAIRWDDGDTLFQMFSRTRAIRRQIIDAGQETAETDFGRAPKGEGE